MNSVYQENYIFRQITGRLVALCESFPIVVVTGARQVGKTTLLRHVFAGADYVALDPAIDVGRAQADPELFLRNHREPLIVDEIQYAPSLVSALKRAVDENRRPGRFILTGSQQWGVLKHVAESLAGRAVFLDLHGFELAEMGGAAGPAGSWVEEWLRAPAYDTVERWGRVGLPFSLFEHLFRGSLPQARVLPLEGIRAFLEGYQRTYIERDVRVLANVSDHQLFGRFLRLAAALTSQELNFAELGRDLGVSPRTANHWLAVLRGTNQWFEIPPYAGSIVKRVSGRPKGYIADTGVACLGLALSSPTAIGSHPALGALMETAVAGEIRRQCSRMNAPPVFHHWRVHKGAEVDLLLERDGRFHPIEVKAATRIDRNDARGIGAFRKSYPHLNIAPGLIVAPIERPFRLAEDTFAVPWDAFVPDARRN